MRENKTKDITKALKTLVLDSSYAKSKDNKPTDIDKSPVKEKTVGGVIEHKDIINDVDETHFDNKVEIKPQKENTPPEKSKENIPDILPMKKKIEINVESSESEDISPVSSPKKKKKDFGRNPKKIKTI